MTRGVAIARDRVFLFIRGGHTVPPMTATISFPVFRRTHCRTIANPFVRTREVVDALRMPAR